MPEFSAAEMESLPRLESQAVRLLWVNDWYDGPLEAVVEHAGERCLMVLNGDVPDLERPMQWVLYRLSEAQWAEEVRWHALFEEHVGHHWCFDHEAPPEPAQPRDAKRFYEPYANRAPRVLEARAAFGWVDEMPAQ